MKAREPLRAPVLLFRSSPALFFALRRRVPGLRGIWWSGDAALLGELPRYVEPTSLFVERVLVEAWHGVTCSAAFGTFEVVEGDDAPRQRSERPRDPVRLLPSNDTHAFLFRKLPRVLEGARFVTCPELDEGADAALLRLGHPFEESALPGKLARSSSALVVGNDWGHVEFRAIAAFRRARVPTACVQESVIFFGDAARRMTWVDYPLVQGLVSLSELDAELTFLTGNPRYEELSFSPLPSRPKVVINSNFTYGTYEEHRETWLEDAVLSATELGLDYLVSQHPRDPADLSRYVVLPSSAGTVHETLRQSSVLVTRFSSLVHEALLLGRPVVYHNPFGESLQYDFEPDGENLCLTRTREELGRALRRMTSRERPHPDQNVALHRYLDRHTGCRDGRATERVAMALRAIVLAAPPSRPVPFVRTLRALWMSWSRRVRPVKRP